MKLLQWNIWYKENIDNIVSELKKFNADIACIQELCITSTDNTNLEKLKTIYPYVYYEVADTFVDGRSQGNAILSKYPFIKTEAKFVQLPTDNKNDYSKEGRIYLEVKIKLNDKDLSIGTTHLSYTHKFEETELKDKEVNKLISFINKNEKFIFAGDLNTTKTSKYIKQLEKILINNETKNTWTTKPFSYNGFDEDKINWKLDYIFSTKDIIMKEINVLSTEYSDHLPILCEFDI